MIPGCWAAVFHFDANKEISSMMGDLRKKKGRSALLAPNVPLLCQEAIKTKFVFVMYNFWDKSSSFFELLSSYDALLEAPAG